MRRFHELEAAVLDEGDAAAREFQLQRHAVRAGAEQHRLALELQAGFALCQHRVGHAARLCGFVFNRQQARFDAGSAVGPQLLGKSFRRCFDDGVGSLQDLRRAAVVPGQREHPRWRVEALRKGQDVPHLGAAKGIDRLRVVAHSGQPLALRFERLQDVGLQAVDVLHFVDQHVVEAAADALRHGRRLHQVPPGQQQVVEVQ